ncbi:hypothetical protein G3576_20990 [Roseomonas stagni]|uniref:Uncharacterized protein n=1 Tax=Falsiroseomonas algicola TaxID=2716930 RepID=A0A6M1LQ34_9PROT|nr:hypothetical protein [Falsiroseomonas algicola]NGM22506.1 hypothetical protein [Falsiroseomonas algicola]
MAQTDRRDSPENTEQMMLMVGSAAAILGYVMPAVVFKGSGNAVHDLSIIEKLPLLSAIAALALVAAIATRFVAGWQRWAEQASVIAILLILAPAVWGFAAAIDVFSSLRPMIVEMAGTRNVRIDPGPAYVPLLVGATMLGMSLRMRRQRLAGTGARA